MVIPRGCQGFRVLLGNKKGNERENGSSLVFKET